MMQPVTDLMQMFSFIDTMTGTKNAPARIPVNEVHVFRKKGYSCVSFSADLGMSLAKDGIRSVRLAKNNFTGDYAFVFSSDEEGHPIHFRLNKGNGRKVNSLRITSKNLVNALFKAFNMPSNADYLELELSPNNSKRPDVKFFTLEKI